MKPFLFSHADRVEAELPILNEAELALVVGAGAEHCMRMTKPTDAGGRPTGGTMQQDGMQDDLVNDSPVAH